jgi:hypothetical protein
MSACPARRDWAAGSCISCCAQSCHLLTAVSNFSRFAPCAGSESSPLAVEQGLQGEQPDFEGKTLLLASVVLV